VPDPPGGEGFVQPAAAYDAAAAASSQSGPRRAAAVAANVLASALLAPAPAPGGGLAGSTAGAPAAARVVKLPAFGAVPSLGLPALPALQFAVDREQLAAARGALGLKGPSAPPKASAPHGGRHGASRDVAPGGGGRHAPHGKDAADAEP